MDIPKTCDVLVVGVGPAGSAAATEIAKGGLSVVAVEKRQEIGAPKRCGEGLSKSAVARMGISLEPRCISQLIKGTTVYSPNRKFVRFDYEEPEGWVIERKMLDKVLAKEAARKGARIFAKTEVIDLKRKGGKVVAKLKTPNGIAEIESKIVIACDGVESKIARQLGLDTTIKLIDIASCAQYEMAGVKIDPDRVELYFGSTVAPGGYCWIFPKGQDSANVGIGVRKPFAKESAQFYLDKFIKSHSGLKEGSVIEVNTGGVPVGGLMENMVEANLIVAGDAAHQVNPVHGGGIAEAFVGGKLAGQTAIKAVKTGDWSKTGLESYNRLWWDIRGKKLKKIVGLRQFMESLSDEDLNWLAEYLKGEDLIGFAGGSGFATLLKLLIKKPKLLSMATKFLVK